IQDDSALRSEEVGCCVDRALGIVGAVVANEDRGVVHRVSFVRVLFKFSALRRCEHRPVHRFSAQAPQAIAASSNTASAENLAAAGMHLLALVAYRLAA